MRKFSSVTISALCLGALLLASCRPLFHREVSGAVLAIEGPAKGTFDGKTFSLTTNDWIHRGEKIATGPGSRLDLMILPGILVELAGETELEVGQLHLARDGDDNIRPMTAREARVRLRRGFMVAAIGQTQIRSRLIVETATGILIAGPGRTFQMKVNEHQTQMLSVRGQIRFEPVNRNTSTKIGPGNFAQWPGVAPRPITQSGAEAQAEVTRILKVERRLLSLEKEEQSAFLPWQR